MFYVYRFLDAEGNTLYVGKTVDLIKRLRTHFSSQGHLSVEQYEQVKSVQYLEFSNGGDMAVNEIYHICKMKPPFNTNDVYDISDGILNADNNWKELSDEVWEPTENRRPGKANKRDGVQPVGMTKELLVELIVEKKMSATEIAEAYGVCDGTVHHWRRKFGLTGHRNYASRRDSLQKLETILGSLQPGGRIKRVEIQRSLAVHRSTMQEIVELEETTQLMQKYGIRREKTFFVKSVDTEQMYA